MNAQLVRTNAILPFAPFEEFDFTGYEGFPVFIDNTTGCIDRLMTAADLPSGVLIQARPPSERSTVALAAGGLAGTVRVKLLQDCPSVGVLLKTVLVNGEVAFGPDTGAGARVVAAQALEKGVAGELIEAVLFKPIKFTS
jgi:hypothetical protein